MRRLGQGGLHATCVDFNGIGVLILGKSSSGKSTLALACIGLGARLVCDDRIEISTSGSDAIASAPPTALDQIEVRGIGLIPCERINTTKLGLVVDLDQSEPERLPPRRHILIKESRVALIHGLDIPNLQYVIKQLVKINDPLM